MQKNRPGNWLGTEKISKLFLRFSIPAITGMLAQALYAIVNGFFIGKYAGISALGAMGLVAPFIGIIAAFSMLFGVGTSVLTSIRSGENRNGDAEEVLSNGFWMLLFTGVPISIFGALLIEPILNITGTIGKTETFYLAAEYGRIVVLGSVFQMIGLGLSHAIRARGNPVAAMATVLIGVAVNVLLDMLFIIMLGWGIRGAAIATVAAQGVSAAAVVLYLAFGKSDIKLRIRKHKLKIKVIFDILRIGSSAFILQFATCVVAFLFNNNLLKYGKLLISGADVEEISTNIVLAGYRIISNLSAFILMPAFGANQGSQPILGYNYGAKRYGRVRAAFRLTASAITVWMCLCFVIAMAMPKVLISLSVKPDENYAHLLNFGATAIRIALISLPIVGIQIISANYFQAIGKPIKAMAVSMSRQVVLLIPLIYIMPEVFSKFFGAENAVYGLMWAGVIADTIAVVITVIMVYAETKRLKAA